MPEHTRITSPGPRQRTVRLASGEIVAVPEGWELLPPGDPGLTDRVKKAGPSWAVQEKRGNKLFSRGVWAPADRIDIIRRALQLEREDPAYARKLDASRRRREEEQGQYAQDFTREVLQFLQFAQCHLDLAHRLAEAIALHSVPVGSGTVARTERIPIERRAEAATIAWMRHATTAYDTMAIPRQKGARREVRRMLADRSRQLLDQYRRGEPVPLAECLLRRGLQLTLQGEP